MKSKVYDLPRSFLKDAVRKSDFYSSLATFALTPVGFGITGLRFEDAGTRAFAVKAEEPHFDERGR
jgi:hypothetical protein